MYLYDMYLFFYHRHGIINNYIVLVSKTSSPIAVGRYHIFFFLFHSKPFLDNQHVVHAGFRDYIVEHVDSFEIIYKRVVGRRIVV